MSDWKTVTLGVIRGLAASARTTGALLGGAAAVGLGIGAAALETTADLLAGLINRQTAIARWESITDEVAAINARVDAELDRLAPPPTDAALQDAAAHAGPVDPGAGAGEG